MGKAIGRPASFSLLALLVLSQPVAPAVITVEGDCTLADAITAANSDTAVGGCPAGSGADEIVLTEDVTLTEELPWLESTITIAGRGFAIARDPSAPGFDIFHADGASVGLYDVALLNGSWALYAYSSGVDLTNTIVSGSVDGGIWIDWRSGATLTNSTISNNGGIGIGVQGGEFEDSSIVLINTTVSGNQGSGVFVGGYTWPVAGLINSTISGNAGHGVQLTGAYGSAIAIENSTIAGNSGRGIRAGRFYTHVVGSVVSTNAGRGCDGGDGIVDGGYNFADDGTCGPGFADLTGLDPVLADNGGPTLTHALLPGASPIDAAADCGLETDQRGVPRDDGACDSGSFEFISVPCVLKVRLGSAVLQSGESLEVELYLQHNRAKTVTVPFVVWVEDETGAVIASRTTPPLTFKQGDTFRRRLTLALPESIAPGRYAVRARIDQMQQGMAEARRQTLVIE